jgi:deazaflavin-dependent oxidoreductase (nitroreductase family)
MLIARFSNLLSRPRWLATRTTRVHGFLLLRTRGRLASRNYFFGPRQRVLALTTIGRRSGSRRTTALGYVRDGDAFALVASNSGLDSPPAWWLNLQANPEAEVNVAGERVRVRGREATREEHERLWPRFVDGFPGLEAYRQFTTREIPVIVLEPLTPEADQPRS